MKTVKKDIKNSSRTKRMKEQTRESPDTYRLLHDTAGVGIAFYSVKGIILSYNRLAAKYMKGKPGDFAGKPVFEVFPEAEAEICFKRIKRAAKTDAPQEYVDRINLPKSVKWFHSTFNRITNSAGITLGVQVILVDITKRKFAEEALRQSEERYRRLLNSGSDEIFIHNVNEDGSPGKFTEVNETACMKLEYTREELLRMSPYEIDAPETRHNIGEITAALKANGRCIFETIHITKSGRRIPMEINAHLFLMDDKPTALSIARDVSERKRAEKEVNESHNLLSHFINQSPIYAFIKSVEQGESRVIYASENYKDMIGISGSDMVGKTMHELFPPEFAEKMTADDWAVVTAGQTLNLEETLNDRNYFTIKFPIKQESRTFLAGYTIDITERRHAEEALQKSEAKFRAIVENLHDGISFTDINSEMLYRSPSFEAINGYTSEERLGKKGFDLIHPDDMNTVRLLWQELVNNPDKIQTATFRTRHKDGSWRYIESTAQNLLANLDINAILQITRDVTERKKAEDALLFSEGRLKMAERFARMGHWEYDISANSLTWSSETYRLYERDPGLGPPTVEEEASYYSPEDNNTLKAMAGQVMATGKPAENIEFRVNLPGGRRPIYSSSITLIADNMGSPVSLFGTVQDITERKRVEESLQASEERFKCLLETVTDYIYTVFIENGKAVKTVHSPGCQGVTGYTSRELETNQALWHDMIHEDDRRHVTAELDNVLAGRNAVSFEHRIYHKDGSVRWVRNTPVPRKNENGRLTAYDGLISDITERKQAEEARELMQSQLRQAQKMEALGTFVGGIAHDFNNILSVLMGFTSLLRMELEKDNPLNAYVEQILSSSERAANLTKSLLSFSRKQPVVQKPINLNNAVREIEKILRRLVTENIKLEIRLFEKDIMIKGDHSQVDQIFLNLATNARDAMPKGGTISISTCVIEFDDKLPELLGYGKPGKYGLITFADNGSGMDSRTKEKIFDPFFTTKEMGKGTGLGMATVYGIVKQHGGHIEIYSEEGSGTAFHIYLPLEENADDTEKISDREAVRAGAEKILVAEDNEDVRFLIRSVLEKYGYAVIEAVDGQDAVNKFRSHRDIDLAILDSVMPGKNGREAYDEITRMNENVRVLFCSGYTRDAILTEGIIEKDFNFLAKPLTPDALLDKVREILDRKWPGGREESVSRE